MCALCSQAINQKAMIEACRKVIDEVQTDLKTNFKALGDRLDKRMEATNEQLQLVSTNLVQQMSALEQQLTKRLDEHQGRLDGHDAEVPPPFPTRMP